MGHTLIWQRRPLPRPDRDRPASVSGEGVSPKRRLIDLDSTFNACRLFFVELRILSGRAVAYPSRLSLPPFIAAGLK